MGKNRNDEEKGQAAERNIDIKNEAPVEVIRNEPTQGRTENTGKAEHGSQKPHVFAPFSWGKELSDNDEGTRHKNASAHALKTAESAQLGHGPGKAAEGGAEKKEADPKQKDGFSSIDVRDPAKNDDRKGR
jgi:hypothetical protein